MLKHLQQWSARLWASAARREIRKDTTIPWEPADEKALALFLGTATGKRLRAKMVAHEHQINAEAVQSHRELPWKSGYACGARDAFAYLLSQAARPENEPATLTAQDLADMDAAALVDRYSP